MKTPKTTTAIRCREGLDDALRILIKIANEYERFCTVMVKMPERKSEVRAGNRLMDALEDLRDELLKRKSPNAAGDPSPDKTL